MVSGRGTPDQVYSDPAKTFVAGFIGSPPMNPVEGTASNGRFTAPGMSLASQSHISGPVSFGIRPEDCTVGGGELSGTVYGVEPTGDCTHLTIAGGKTLFEVKAQRDFRALLDSPITIGFDPARLYFFDTTTGLRLRGA